MSWKHSGYTIEINGSGQFTANLGADDGVLYAATLVGVKEKIDVHVRQRGKPMLSLPIVATLNSTEIYVGVLVGVNRSDSTWQTDPPFKKRGEDGRLTDLLADTPTNRKRVAALVAARRNLKDAEAEIKGRSIDARTWGGRIEPADYDALIQKLQAQHLTSANESVDS